MTSKLYANRTSETGWSALGLQVPFRDAIRCADTIYVTGQVATEALRFPDGFVGAVSQAESAIEKISDVLGQLGGSLEDVVKINGYYTSADAIRACRPTLIRHFPNGVAENNVVVDGLANPRWSVEIEAVAIVGGARQVVSSSKLKGFSAVEAQGCEGLRCGPVTYLSGQLPRDPDTGLVSHPLNSERQTRAVFHRIRDLLMSVEMDLDDVVQVRSYHTSLKGLTDSVRTQGEYFLNGVAGTAVILPALAVTGCDVQIEVVASVDPLRRSSSGSSLGEVFTDRSFRSAVRAGDTVYFSAQFATADVKPEMSEGRWAWETRQALDQIQEHGSELGVGIDDIIKTNVYWIGDGDWSEAIMARARYFKLGPATTGVTASSLPVSHASIAIEAIAVI